MSRLGLSRLPLVIRSMKASAISLNSASLLKISNRDLLPSLPLSREGTSAGHSAWMTPRKVSMGIMSVFSFMFLKRTRMSFSLKWLFLFVENLSMVASSQAANWRPSYASYWRKKSTRLEDLEEVISEMKAVRMSLASWESLKR